MLSRDGGMSIRIKMAPDKKGEDGKVHVTHDPVKIKSLTRILAIFLRSSSFKGKTIDTIDVRYSK